MQEAILSISEQLTTIVKENLPDTKEEMRDFISYLDGRFPNLPNVIRSVFESEFERKFGEKFVW